MKTWTCPEEEEGQLRMNMEDMTNKMTTLKVKLLFMAQANRSQLVKLTTIGSPGEGHNSVIS